MRVGFDVREYSHTPAGIGNYCGELASALVPFAPGDQFLLYGHHSFPAGAVGRNVRHRIAGDCWRFGWRRSLWENLVLPFDLLRHRVDVFHATSHIVPPAWHGGRLVFTVHDMTNFLFPEWYPARNNAYRRRMIRRGVRRARAIITPSRSTAADIEKLFPGTRDRVHIVQEGVSAVFSPRSPDRVPEISEACRGRFILFVGTLSPRKNVSRLIEAFSLVSKEPGCEGLRLILAGMRGWMSDEVFARMGGPDLKGRVHHVGFVPRETLAEMYRRALLVCLPSLYEGFGLPVLEAMASGTPVLVSNRSSLPELAPDEACLADPKNAEDLAEKMARLLDDEPLRRRVREAGLEKARDFTWETAAAETLRVYREAV